MDARVIISRGEREWLRRVKAGLGDDNADEMWLGDWWRGADS